MTAQHPIFSENFNNDNNESFTQLLNLKTATITQAIKDSYQLDYGVMAVCATSCIIKPRVNDFVLVLKTDKHYYILNILQRSADVKDAELHVANSRSISMHQETINIQAYKSLKLGSFGDLSIEAALGQLWIMAKNIYNNAADCIIEQASSIVSKSDQHHIEAEQLLKTHGGHQLQTADKEFKVDAERIHMG